MNTEFFLVLIKVVKIYSTQLYIIHWMQLTNAFKKIFETTISFAKLLASIKSRITLRRTQMLCIC